MPSTGKQKPDMNFDFSADQKALGDHVRRYLHDKCPRDVVRRVLENGQEQYAAEVWRGLAHMGLMGTAIAPHYGGAGLGYLELCVIAQELGRVMAPVPFSSSIYLAAEAINLAGSPAQKERWLPGLASGEIIGTLAACESSSEPLGKAVRTKLAGGRISGRKLLVPDGNIADIAIVLARSGGSNSDRLAFALVELGLPSIRRELIQTIDASRSHAEVVFDSAPAQLLGEAGAGADLLRALYDRAAVLFAFEQLGGADAALEMACGYAKQRFAFGRPIGSFQAIKHKLAEIYMRNTLARSHAYYGAWALSSGAPELALAAAAARASASEAFDFAAKENLQTHGGMGFTWELDCHLFYRRARMLSLALGSPRLWKDRLVTELEARATA
jgi:alkylation response protein AidB-like acyl-CoA dehydrogenase